MSTSKTIFNPLLSAGLQKLSTTAESFAAVTLEPTGFEDPNGVGVSYSYTDRKITLTHSSGTIAWWYRGVRHTVASPWTSAAHDVAAGSYYLTINGAISAAAWSGSAWTFGEVQVAFVQRGASAALSFALRETHGLQQWQSHEEDHQTIGTYWRSGLTLDGATYTINGTTDANNTYGINSGVIKDEDVSSTVNALPEGTYTIGYRNGAGGAWVFSIVETLPFLVVSNTLQWNQNTAGVWARANTSEDNYVNYYDYVLPVASDADSQKYRHILIPGQAQYTTLAAAQLEFPQNLDLGTLTDLSPEFVCVNRITMQFNASGGGSKSTTGRCAIQAVTPIRGTRATQVAIAGAAPSVHNNLSGRADAACHPIEAIGDDATQAGRVVFTDAAGALDTDSGFSYNPATDTMGVSALQAATSAGFTIKSSSGATVADFGPGGGQAAAFSDGASFSGTVSADTIAEKTSGAGVTIDSVLLKDGQVQTNAALTTAEATATITAGNAIDLSAAKGTERWYAVTGNAAGQNAMSATPFGASAPTDPLTVWLVGQSNDNTVTLATNDAARGAFVAGGFIELGKGTAVCFKYSPTLARWVEIARNNYSM